MQVSRKYLEQYFDLSTYSNQDLSDLLTNAGFEVEGLLEYNFNNLLVVGLVKECIEHPDSDHLHICQVDVGSEILQIVCGAPNVAVNQKVIVALNGCQLPEIKIVKSKVRGVESNGMLCSLLELGVEESVLSESQKNGIEILDEQAAIGESVLPYVGLDDAFFELGLTPNRSDVVALNNLLKEVAAIVNQSVTIEIPNNHFDYTPSSLHVSIHSKNANYLSAQLVKGITLKESSVEIQNILTQNGIKSINNLVDISNYVMLLTGQPNHIYDARQVKGGLKVVDDYEGEFTALDGNVYQIIKGDLMIFDDEKPLGIAGIMGGEFSKVVDDTQDIVIEIASFERMSIRNTARRLNINSESSVKYQKNIDPQAVNYASEYLNHLLKTQANATAFEEKIESNPKQFNIVTLDLDVERLNKHLGSNFSAEQVFYVMKRLDFKVNKTQVEIPTYRSDITVVEDLHEEVIRLLGYDHLPTTLPQVNASNRSLPYIQRIQREITQFLSKNGFYNALTYTLVSDRINELALNPTGETIKLSAPLSEERKYIRRSIIPSLLESVAYNETRSVNNIALFEISDVTSETGSENRLAIIANGNLQQNNWNKYTLKADFYLIKSLVLALLQNLGFDSNRIFIKENKESTTLLHPYQSAEIYLGRDLLGTIGNIHPLICKEFGIKNSVVAELNLTLIANTKVSKVKYKPISKFQSVNRDIAMLADISTTFDSLKAVILKEGKQLVKEIEVFDIYQGEHIEKGKKSIAIRITLQSETETLDTNTINQLMENIATTLQNKCNVIIR